MSRIGKLPVAVPSGVNVTLADDAVTVKGPKGELRHSILSSIVAVKLEDGKVVVERKGEARTHRAAHGLTRTLIANMVEGVSKGYRKSLEIQGVGFRAAKSGERLNLSLGFSHPVVYEAPKGIALSVEGQNKIHVDGIDKQAVGQVAAEIRGLRPPEPYKGKGIRYAGEVVRKKLGKAGKAGKK
ncbi:MAG: 50S ribosomal protein L6 [Candidatus Eremiobacteraeota bacterium]|nr:50S ribosomal protein L6 [Candidatus Eremiobacteraeota bacterium]MBV8284514.1 50S ribosomal protein L6 [Candidatus Eremiobacteraeota bacterium]MBV8434147.1 50S ribosomal protein L6 [Candidatus Eremiobacteraeota bacterium]MBV8582362.1 50S ribosomal protein L6 [Candidatus Eremiobacteraeota bacterium]